MKKEILKAIETPAFLLDEQAILKALGCIKKIKKAPVSVLYSLKPLANPYVLQWMAPSLDGFATSSLFESKLAHSILRNKNKTVHIITPGYRVEELEELDILCSYITLNSLTQLTFFKPVIKNARIGLRIQPELSFVKDARFNPERPNSKLGVPLRLVGTDLLKEISGIHFHTNCNASSFIPLLRTVRKVVSYFGDHLNALEWINLGGGYLFSEIEDFDPFYEAIEILSRYHLKVFVEPGATFVRSGGTLISSVIDLFETYQMPIAVLDTTVNHLPEVFEYQISPSINNPKGNYLYLLAGSSCLAGDIFGTYKFKKALNLNSKIIFNNVGDYSHVKSHMFNGINLPNQYILTKDGNLEVKRRFGYEDFLAKY